MHPLHVFGGAAPAPTLLVLPGNGFPPPCYAPLVAPLTRDWRALCLPPRALWPEIGPAPVEQIALDDLAQDLLTGMGQQGLGDVVGVGHSLGALVLIQAALEQPQRFRGLVLLDPVILSHERIDFVRMMRERGTLEQIPIVDGALRRRDRFPDLQTAYNHWRPKPLFAEMDDEALWVYTRAATCPAADGAGLELTWPRDWEATYFMLAGMDVWDSLLWLNNMRHTLILRGGASDVLTQDSLQRLQLHLPHTSFVTLPDCGHLFPLSHPAATRAALAAWLQTLT